MPWEGPNPKRHANRLYTTVWDDATFPFVGRNVDSTTGRIGYDYDELGIFFADNARYAATEQVSMVHQLSHSWAEGTAIGPHFHWLQASSDIPNFMIAWRVTQNGETPGAYTLAKYDSHAFTYTSGTILQITTFPDIAMTGKTISCLLDIKFFRDSANASALFAGADPLTGNVIVKAFDNHFERDTGGSYQEYIKAPA